MAAYKYKKENIKYISVSSIKLSTQSTHRSQSFKLCSFIAIDRSNFLCLSSAAWM